MLTKDSTSQTSAPFIHSLSIVHTRPRDFFASSYKIQKSTMTTPPLAAKRLFSEYRTLSQDPPEGITAGPISEDNMFVWEALIQGPEGTPFDGGIFPAELKFPKDYPLSPPTMRFTCDMYHPNGILKTKRFSKRSMSAN
jgi:hypothetical protein